MVCFFIAFSFAGINSGNALQFLFTNGSSLPSLKKNRRCGIFEFLVKLLGGGAGLSRCGSVTLAF